MKPSKVIVDMRHYIKELLKEYPYELNKNIECPWNGKLFENDNNMEQLTKEHAEAFHTFVMKCMFLAKRGRPDILTGIGYLSTKVLQLYEADLKKLSRIISYSKKTINMQLTLEANNTQTIAWYVNSSFGVHKDMRSQTGLVYILGKGCIVG